MKVHVLKPKVCSPLSRHPWLTDRSRVGRKGLGGNLDLQEHRDFILFTSLEFPEIKVLEPLNIARVREVELYSLRSREKGRRVKCVLLFCQGLAEETEQLISVPNVLLCRENQIESKVFSPQIGKVWWWAFGQERI